SSQARERFVREAKLAAALTHPHVVVIHQVGEDDGVIFLAMELLEGESLAARLTRGPLPTEEIVRVGGELSDALAAFHGVGVVHRDVSPANVWLHPGAGVKLLDFGLAKHLGESPQLTKPGTILGTPAYLSPEQARSQAVDARADLFSLGSVLYE